jgi:hypothetical protein
VYVVHVMLIEALSIILHISHLLLSASLDSLRIERPVVVCATMQELYTALSGT